MKEDLDKYIVTNLEKEIERLKEKYERMKENAKILSNGYNELEKRNEKALDKLYCYGEVFDSKILQQFQKEMENILQGDDKDVKD